MGVLVSLLAGFGIGALLTWPSAHYTEEAAISMQSTRALQPMQASKASAQFLQPLMKMESRVRALPPAALKKLDVKTERDLVKAIAVAGGALASPHAAHAAKLTPSVANLLNSVVAGGAVVAVLAIAVLAVATFDPVERSA